MFTSLLIFIAVVGLIVWVCSLLPLPDPFQRIILVVGIIAVALKLLSSLFGIHVL